MPEKERHVRVPIFWKDFLAGYISGVANILSGQPFDICKVRMATMNTGSLVKTFQAIVKDEGLLKLWSGSTFPLIFYGICNSIVFAVNEKSKYFFRRQNKSIDLRYEQFWISGALAGVANAPISAPMEHIRIRLQTDKTGKYSGSFDAAWKIFQEHGLRGIYKGFLITLLREFVLYGFYFSTYEILKQKFNTDNGFVLMSIGGLGGMSGWCSAFLIDNLKSRIQTDHFVNPRYHSWQTIRPVLTWAQLSKGFTAGFFRSYPVNCITFITYELAADLIYQDKKK